MQQRLEQEKQLSPPGLNLIHILVGPSASITRIAWSPDGRRLAVGSFDDSIELWDAQSGRRLRTLTGHTSAVLSVAWSPDGRWLASGSDDRTIELWDLQSGQRLHSLTGHTSSVSSVAWSSDGRWLASSSDDGTIGLWDPQSGQRLHSLTGHTSYVNSVAWSPDGKWLASGSADKTIGLWDPGTGKLLRRLEGHTGWVTCVAFSGDGRLLASKSQDHTVRLWNTVTWQAVVLPERAPEDSWLSGLAFHPIAPLLATLDQMDWMIRLWSLDMGTLLRATSAPARSYTTAKMVLVGDSGVGKSGLGLVLAGQPFEPTESTHGRRIWRFEQREVTLPTGEQEQRETWLWDLAGQPGYRLIHQLHLNEVALALVVFDARSETDPFAGIQYWERALRQAQHVQGEALPPLKKFLVAARADRGGVAASRERIEALARELGFAGYFETSAKEGWQIAELSTALREAIDWDAQPKVSSTELFQRIKAFLTTEKEAGRFLSTREDLYRTFLQTKDAPAQTDELWAQFLTCIGRVEAAGLIKQLSFGNFVLLQPELLDAYASALVNAVKEEPDGLGSMAEEQVRTGRFRMSKEERLQEQQQEQLLLIAMVEDLLRRELALREEAFLVFPSQSTREHPDLPDPAGGTVIFAFQGPVLNLYATLAVRLSPTAASSRSRSCGGMRLRIQPMPVVSAASSCATEEREAVS